MSVSTSKPKVYTYVFEIPIRYPELPNPEIVHIITESIHKVVKSTVNEILLDVLHKNSHIVNEDCQDLPIHLDIEEAMCIRNAAHDNLHNPPNSHKKRKWISKLFKHKVKPV